MLIEHHLPYNPKRYQRYFIINDWYWLPSGKWQLVGLTDSSLILTRPQEIAL